MRAIMISIKPKWVAEILNGKKTIEVRKTCPQVFKHLKPYEGCSIDVYIYCTKDEKYPLVLDVNGCIVLADKHYCYGDIDLNGKVVAKFTLKRVEEIRPTVKLGLLNTYNTYETKTLVINPLLEKCCLSYEELDLYLKWKVGYAWYIDNLVIFNKPKELSEFRIKGEYKCSKGKCPYYATDECKHASVCTYNKILTKAPQSWCYVESEE